MSFQGFLKQSTSVDVILGPFLDETDGKTAEAGLTISQADVKLSKNGQALAQKNDANACAADGSDGYYNGPLNATDTDTVGQLTVIVHESGALPIRLDYHVVEEAVYDAMYGGSAAGPLQSTTAARKLDVTATGAAGVDWGNVENKTTANDLTGTNIKTDQKVDIETIKTQAVTAAAGVTVYAYLGDGAEPGTSGGLATSDQISSITNSGSAVSTDVSSYALTTGTQSSGTYASTHELDGTSHQHTDTGGAMDLYYEFNIGSGSPAEVTSYEALTGNNDDLKVLAYDWVASGWKQVGTLNGTVAATITPNTYKLTTAMVGTGADIGKVRLRYWDDTYTLTTATLYVDYMLLSFNLGTGGYSDGIEVDTNGSNTNTVPNVDGVKGNPVSTWAAALSLSTATNIKEFYIHNGSSIELSANSDNYTLTGMGWTLALGGRSIEGLFVEGASASGTGLATTTRPRFEKCGFGNVTLGPCILRWCGLGGTFTAGSDGEFAIVDCVSMVAGSGSPTLVFTGTGSATGINVRRWAGGATYTLDSDCTLSHEVLAGGGTTVTTGGADVEIRGITRSVTCVLSGAGTVQFAGVTGPITLSGAATTTVNLYGVSSSLTDTSSGTTVTDETTSNSNMVDEWETQSQADPSGFYVNTDGAEELTDGGFEDVTGDDWTSWTETNAGTGSITDETVVVHAGTHAVKLLTGDDAAIRIQQDITLTAGQSYRVSFWTRGEAGDDAGRYRVYQSSDVIAVTSTGVTGTTWQRVSATFEAAETGSASIMFYGSATATDVVYYDDASVVAVNEVSAQVEDILEDTGTTIPAAITALHDPTAAAIADAVCDEVITAAEHNVVNSFARRVRDIASDVTWTGDAVSATANTLTLDATASATDGSYDPSVVIATEGTGLGQVRGILEYFGTAANDNANKTLILDRDWKVQPDATTNLTIVAHNGHTSTNEGQLRGGSTTTATLNSLAPTNEDLTGSIIQFVSGTGQDQSAWITAYNGATKVATFAAVNTALDATTGYRILPFVAINDPTAAEIWELAGKIDGKTPQEALRYIAAVCAGILSGAGTGSETVKGLDKTTSRAAFTVDASGNRTAVTYDP